MDNYSGVNGVIINPSAVVDSNFRTDINLFSMSSFLGSDYYSIDLNAALESEDGFSFGNSIKTSATNQNQFFLNVDVLGPSFMFNLNPKSSLAVTTRVRTFLNFNNVNGMIYEDMEDGFNSEEDYSFELKDFSSTVHAWGELGLTYGRILMDTDSNFLKAGLTVKYLQGAGATFIHSPQATGQYEAQTELLTTSGTLSYGGAVGFDSDDIDFNDLTSGFGADFGMTYEYRPDNGLEEEKGHSDYKFRLGLSVTDLGSISYESTVTTYDLDETVDANRFDQEGFRTVLEQEYEGTEEMKDTKISLPTALHVMGDYNISKHFYVSVQGNLSLVSADAEHANRIINTVAATPRFESKWFSFYLPVSMRQYDGLAMGAGFRLGPLMVGSGSLISNVLGDSAKTTDIYAGLKIPIYR
ncbi:hypothetical protein GCM10010465_00930 [Actinomadura fibrosa]